MLVQNASPYTFFGERGVVMAEGVSLHSGDLAGVILKRTSPLDIPSIAWRALSSRAKISGHRQDSGRSPPRKGLRIRSLDDRHAADTVWTRRLHPGAPLSTCSPSRQAR